MSAEESSISIVYSDTQVNKNISKKYKDLSEDQLKTLNDIKEFNEDLYNNWIGDAGDEFINAACTIHAYLVNAIYKSDTCGDLINDWSDKFAEVDQLIQETYQDNVMLEGN